MHWRCQGRTERNYLTYTANGITVCERWSSFENFLADMGQPPTENHTLDRIETTGNYEPGNCRWATMREQQNNRGNNRLISHGGHSLTAPEWERRTGIHRATIEQRIALGWSIERTLTEPPTPGRRRGAATRD